MPRFTHNAYFAGKSLVVGTVLGLVILAVAAAGLLAAEQGDAQDKRVEQLIQQLGDKDYFVRQRAQIELAKLGFEAFDALTAAENHEDLEIATRVKYLLRLMRVNWTVAEDPPEVKRYLANYESLPPDDRLAAMRNLSGLPEGVGIPALCRLIRFEKSQRLSKRAAVEILGRQPPDQPPSAELADTLRKNFGHNRRKAAGWLMTYVGFRDDPQKALASWIKLVDEELAVLKRKPGDSDPVVAAALVRCQINWLAKLGRKQQAVAAMWKLIDLNKGDPESLAELLDWLVEQKAWDAIGKVAERFADRFAKAPIFLYTLAQAQMAQGKKALAEETAQRAHALHSGPQPDDLVTHLMTAFTLRRRGLFAWAERELRYVIAKTTNQNLAVTARSSLAEMLHDRGNELAAAEVLKPLVEAMGKRPNVLAEAIGRSPGAFGARMNLFYANHWGEQGDRQEQRKRLEAALAADPTDCDVLIACYRLPGSDDAWRARIKGLIEKSADLLRQQIAEHPDEALYYNQFAWLIGNTEGDFNEALKCSKKSIELEPNAGGYYDTLGRVYYGKGDYANAVKFQSKAARLDPHSGLIAKQLALFQKALARQKQKAPSPPNKPGVSGEKSPPPKTKTPPGEKESAPKNKHPGHSQ